MKDAQDRQARAQTLSLGVYTARNVTEDGIMLSGYASYEAVTYDVDASELRTRRPQAGAGLSGSYALAQGTLTPRAQVWGTWEDFPEAILAEGENAQRQLFASLGGRMDWAIAIPNSQLQPFASFDATLVRLM